MLVCLYNLPAPHIICTKRGNCKCNNEGERVDSETDQREFCDDPGPTPMPRSDQQINLLLLLLLLYNSSSNSDLVNKSYQILS